jgi:DNA-binding beta-propeller fold protein YncE
VALDDGTLAVVSVRAYTSSSWIATDGRSAPRTSATAPSHLVADRRGRLYVADTRGGGISVFDTQPRLRFAARVSCRAPRTGWPSTAGAAACG